MWILALTQALAPTRTPALTRMPVLTHMPALMLTGTPYYFCYQLSRVPSPPCVPLRAPTIQGFKVHFSRDHYQGPPCNQADIFLVLSNTTV
ncbi:uncharacterized protein F5891DRAFT_239091 [Suillus fuscotomentosus]|uniref:Uncharacterized protein n=1 Tax=Suillus fuscotomentosus TaxID=1912939 RepID=A0AAD4DP59_9AGAM|nr:uncharacterized protein F5891DRAFT_239091 [Suillus fuscotomentosus]KAG1887479.1 hypothetical protein F5891DRAFT_239091 [Suillus fuscotomentosus]